MPTNKNATTRYKILDELLSNRYRSYSLDDIVNVVNERLAEMLISPVSRRCIEKDLKYLEEGPFEAEIERYSAPRHNANIQKDTLRRCLRYADPSFSIFKKPLTDDEKHLLASALSILGQFEGLPNFGELDRLRKSLNTGLQERRVISFSRNSLENSTLIGELFTAISQRQVVEIHYHRFDTPDTERWHILHPYLLKESNNRWFLFGASEATGALLNFALDRIDKVVPLPAHDYIPFDGDLDEWFEDIIGVTNFANEPVQTILFWVSDASKDYVLTKPLHDSQRHYTGRRGEELRKSWPQLSGGEFFSIECKRNYELIRALTGYGGDLVVLSPENIRQEIITRIESMRSAYAETNVVQNI